MRANLWIFKLYHLEGQLYHLAMICLNLLKWRFYKIENTSYPPSINNITYFNYFYFKKKKKKNNYKR